MEPTLAPQLIGADLLHAKGITGLGVGIAVLDSGAYGHVAFNKDTRGWPRLVAQYNAISATLEVSNPVSEILRKTDGTGTLTDDYNGHGTHVASIALSSVNLDRRKPRYEGVAPDAYLISVKAFDQHGQATYADVITASSGSLTKDVYGIRVLNCSFGAGTISATIRSTRRLCPRGRPGWSSLRLPETAVPIR